MTYKYVLRTGVLLLTVLLTACFHEDDPGNPYGVLDGEWHGRTIVTSGGTSYIYYVSFFMDATGVITKINLNGTSTGLTGTTTSTGANTFSYALSDGVQGGFMLDPAGKHLGFIDTDFDYGILQKGALQSVTYVGTEIAGTWSGYSLELNNSLDVVERVTSSASIATSSSFTAKASDGVTTTGTMPTFHSTYGYWLGTGSNSDGNSGKLLAMMSEDKTFAATWACINGYSGTFEIYNVGGCSFSIWNKQ